MSYFLLARTGILIHIIPMRFLCVCAVCVGMMTPVNVWAAKGDAHKQELSRVETSIAEQKSKQKKLQRDQAALEKRLESVRRDMVAITREVQKQERAVFALRKEQDKTESDIMRAQTELDDQKEALAVVISALYRMNRVPPEALLARPSAPIDMARSFALLQKVVPTVSQQAEDIKQVMLELGQLRETQKERETELLAQQKELKKRQEDLEKMVKERRSLLAENTRQQEKSRSESDQLARQAKDIRDLMARLERQERQERTRPKPANKIIDIKRDRMTSASENQGQGLVGSLKSWLGRSVSLPVTGDVVTGYGDKMPGGGVSQGLRINASKGAVVTSPSDGVIRFAGPFRQYKLLVIIQHSNGDHSLLGGMQELYTKTGAKVVAGEPLGKLPKLEGDSTRTTSLYYERRRNGKPIDPRRA